MDRKVFFAMCLVALQAALPVAHAGENVQPLTLGTFSSEQVIGLEMAGGYEADWRPAIHPLLRFNGRRWVDVRSLLRLSNEEHDEAYEPPAEGQRKRRLRKVPDLPLRKAENLANVAPKEWLKWYAVEDGTQVKTSGARRQFGRPESAWELAVGGSKLKLRSSPYVSVSTNANAVTLSKIVPDSQTAALREYAAKQFEAMDARTLTSDAYKGGVEMYKERAEITRRNGNEAFVYRELPKTVAQLRKFPLQWWSKTRCAESASQATTVCQVVANRQFYNSTEDNGYHPQMHYEGFVRQRSGEKPELLFASAYLHMDIEWLQSEGAPNDDLEALVLAGNKLWIWSFGSLEDGSQYCVFPVEKQSADRSKWVCGNLSF